METGHIVQQVEVFRQNSRRLLLESFKIESFISMMNNCSDRCNLQYRESGVKAAEGADDVSCFNICLRKSHGLNKLISQ